MLAPVQLRSTLCLLQLELTRMLALADDFSGCLSNHGHMNWVGTVAVADDFTGLMIPAAVQLLSVREALC